MHDNPRSTASVLGHPLHPLMIVFPITLFVGTLACDIVYVSGDNLDWARAARWMVGVGVIMGLLAALLGLTDFLGDRRIRALSAAWLHAGGNLLAVLISLYSFWLRYERGDAAAQPTGLVLSIIVVLILVGTGWLGGELVFRHRVGVLPPGGEI